MKKKVNPLVVVGGLIAALSNLIFLPLVPYAPDWLVIALPLFGVVLIAVGLFLMLKRKKDN